MRAAARLFLTSSFLLLGCYFPKFGRYPVYDWLGLVAVLTVALNFVVRKRTPKLNWPVVTGCSFLLIGAALTVTHESDIIGSIIAALLLIYLLIVWVPVASEVMTTTKHLRAAFGALGISAAITTIYALGQRFLGLPFLGDPEINFWGRVTGLTRHPNELGTFAAMVFPCLLCLTATTRSFGWKFAWGAAAALVCIGVFLSGSMTGTLALALSAVVYLATLRGAARLRGLGGLLFLAGALVVFAGYNYKSDNKFTAFARVSAFFDSEQGRFTAQQRLVANANAVAYITSTPFRGHGYNSEVATLEGGEIEVHNSFLRAWFDGGFFTFAGFLAVLFGGVRNHLRSRRKLRELQLMGHRLDPYWSAIAGSLVGLFISMQTSPILYQRSAWFPVALAFGLNSIVNRVSQRTGGLSPLNLSTKAESDRTVFVEKHELQQKKAVLANR